MPEIVAVKKMDQNEEPVERLGLIDQQRKEEAEDGLVLSGE